MVDSARRVPPPGAPTPHPRRGAQCGRRRALGNAEGGSGMPAAGAWPSCRRAAGEARPAWAAGADQCLGCLSGASTRRLASPANDRYLVDSASSHMLVSKIKPCMSEYKQLYGETANGSLYKLSFI